MSDQNPYAPPKAPLETNAPVNVTGDTCPKCKSTNVHRPGFTWWGGAIGPRILSHAVCRSCGFGFNWKTGQSNTTGIVIYSVLIFAIGIAILIAVRS